MSPQTQNKAKPVAVVTGGSRGIGAEICKALSREGFTVVIGYSSQKGKAEDVCGQIRAEGGTADIAAFDVADSKAVEKAFQTIFSEHGGLEVLVNNAGINKDALLIRLKDEDLKKTLEVDLMGAIFCSREAAKLMIKKRSGSIIQVSSVVGEMGNPGQAAYAAAKAGLVGFTKSIAKELAGRNIRANVVAPGFIQTEMTQNLNDAQREMILNGIPLGFLGEPSDVAHCVSFLASPKSRYVTGQVISVNGGMYI